MARSLRAKNETREKSKTLEEVIERRAAFLVDYQNAAYARRYRARVERVRQAETACMAEARELTDAVARYLFKLMSAKDEYEVARLYTNGAFQRQLDENFEGDLRLELHLAPPIPFLQRKNDFGGSRKITFGPWMFSVMKILARLKWLRGSWFDITRFNNDRIVERKILADYEALIDEIVTRLTPRNHATAVSLARVPEKIRGFGHIKARHIALAQAEEARLLMEFRATEAPAKAAAE